MPFSLNDAALPRYSFDVFDASVVRPRTAGAGVSGAGVGVTWSAASGGLARPLTSGAGRPASSARPATARVTTASGQYNVVVLAENRARQVGLAVCNLAATHTIELMQLADNQSFSQALALLHVLAPVEIVIPKSQVERVLFQKVVAQWGSRRDGAGTPATQISAINRRRVGAEARSPRVCVRAGLGQQRPLRLLAGEPAPRPLPPTRVAPASAPALEQVL